MFLQKKIFPKHEDSTSLIKRKFFWTKNIPHPWSFACYWFSLFRQSLPIVNYMYGLDRSLNMAVWIYQVEDLSKKRPLESLQLQGADIFLLQIGIIVKRPTSKKWFFKKVLSRSRKHSLKSSLYHAYQEKCCFHLEMFGLRHLRGVFV